MGDLDEYRDILALCADMSLTTEEVRYFGLVDSYPAISQAEEHYANTIMDMVSVQNTFNKGGYNVCF